MVSARQIHLSGRTITAAELLKYSGLSEKERKSDVQALIDELAAQGRLAPDGKTPLGSEKYVLSWRFSPRKE